MLEASIRMSTIAGLVDWEGATARPSRVRAERGSLPALGPTAAHDLQESMGPCRPMQ